MAILVNGVKVAGVGVPGTNGKDATINGVNALTVEGLDPIVAQMVGSALQISLSGDIGGAKVETGSYVGTGTYGVNNQNEVTSTFPPKAVFVFRDSALNGGIVKYGGAGIGGFGYNTESSFLENTVKWYYADKNDSYGPQRQANESGRTYGYIVLG